MHAGFAAPGLRTDQAPPLSIPARFFLLAPLAMIAGGIVLLQGSSAIGSRWLPLAFAATHVGTIGFLGSIMLGALYQMTPVVAGAEVPRIRLAHAVWIGWIAGGVALVAGLATSRRELLVAAPWILGAALAAFLGPVAIALARAPARTETVWGMRLAVSGLAAIGLLGTLLSYARAYGRLPVPGDWTAWLAAHAVAGGLVWIGGLIAAVSWQVVPMFYLTEPVPRAGRVATIASVGVALAGAVALPPLGAPWWAVALGAAPAAIAIFIVNPALLARALRRRKRRRADASLSFWWAGLLCAPLVLGLAAATALSDDARVPVALGFAFVWGHAALIAHGMLSRIVPFLVWFHRFSSLAGRADVPSMRELLPERRVRLGLALHGGAVVLGLIGIGSGTAAIARVAGGLLAIAGAVLGANLVHVLRRRPRG